MILPAKDEDLGAGSPPIALRTLETIAGKPRLGPAMRVTAALLAILLMTALAVAARLEPDPRGFGTHEQLGRPPCAILRLTGKPCPTCGMTTAFAWFVRGGVAQSWAANPAGLVWAIGSVPLAGWLLACSATGRSLGVRSLGESLAVVVVVAIALAALTWFVRRSLSLI